ncbi:MAG: hypothetical protein ACWA5A_10485 [Marinibacterium sp.]
MQTRISRRTRGALALPALLILSACETPAGRTDPQTGYLAKLPDGVTEIAAPGQDLTAVQLSPEDGCYWYRYDGPVETTLLPLRTRDGRPICTQPKA